MSSLIKFFATYYLWNCLLPILWYTSHANFPRDSRIMAHRVALFLVQGFKAASNLLTIIYAT